MLSTYGRTTTVFIFRYYLQQTVYSTLAKVENIVESYRLENVVANLEFGWVNPVANSEC